MLREGEAIYNHVMELPVLEGDHTHVNQALQGELVERLRGHIKGSIHIDAHHIRLYATDASLYEVAPIAVVIPRERADIAMTLSACSALGLPVLGRGAGTSLAGQTVSRAVVIDCSVHLDEISSVTMADDQAEALVDPGVVLDALQERAAEESLVFGPDVASSAQATLGGMIMNCSAGAHSLVYGMTDEHVIGLEVVLADGSRLHLYEGAAESDPRVRDLTDSVVAIVRSVADEIDRRFPDVRRNVAGYALDDILAQVRASTPGTHDKVNLARLICGSEGTLAFLERARIRLMRRPFARCTAVLRFKGIPDAMRAVAPILETGPAAVELIDESIMAAAAAQEIYREDVDTLRFEDGSLPAAALYVSWFLEPEEQPEERFALLEAKVPGGAMFPIRDEALEQRIWGIRKVGLGLISKAEGAFIPMPGLEDCAVGADRLESFIADFDALLEKHGRSAVHYAHASVGLLHLRPRFDMSDMDDREAFLQLGREVLQLVRAHGGTISGEHGDGRIRSELVHEFYGKDIVDAFKAIKECFDPEGRLNPGNKVEPRQAMSSLRASLDSGDDSTVDRTFFSFAEEGSLAAAASACDGNGNCRRARGGAMCPSYRVTREERHATRGRANALAAAIRGELDMNDPAMVETFSLCVGCKACRHECPSNVDVARMKSEFLAQRWQRHGAPLRERLIGKHFHRLNRAATRMPWVANALAAFGPTRWLLARTLGLAASRTLPRFERSLRARTGSGPAALDDERPVVLLFPDCFTNCNEVDNGTAAIELLEAFGYGVVVPDADVCCGRAAISGGFLPMARQLLERSSAVLEAHLAGRDVRGIVVLEPSCASAIKEEWIELRSDVDPALLARIAGLTDVLEGFLLDHWDRHPCHPDFKPSQESILVHQHCHMKHTGRRLAELLERCIDGPIELVDSGCCGMAGSFGYRAAHQEVSLAMAEDSLGRFLEAHPGDVVAPGTSCRQQVQDVFGNHARHPASLLRDALRSKVSR